MIENLIRRIGFGLRPEERVPTDIGLWIDEQLDLDAQYLGVEFARPGAPISKWPDTFKLSLKEIYKRSSEYNRLYDQYTKKASQYSMQELLDIRRTWIHENEVFWRDETRLFHSAIYGDEQVRQRLIHFWANHFTVGDGANERKFIAHHIEDAIGKNLKGSFNELLYEAVKSPAMVHYLDNIYNVGESSAYAAVEKTKPVNKRTQVGLNDNLAREILELHTVTPRLAYTEADIREVARILAGWGLDHGHRGSKPFNLKYDDLYYAKKAEPGLKEVFGKKFTKGRSDLRDLTDYLAKHEMTISHLSYKLCQHFIADVPTKDQVRTVIASWKRSDGDLVDIHRTVLSLAVKSETPKFQWPMTWFLQSLRVSGASLVDGWAEVRPDRDGRTDKFVSKPRTLSQELGQGFWLKRQPNGYSQKKDHWISPAHFERRVRFSQLIANYGQPVMSPTELMARFNYNEDVRRKVLAQKDQASQFVIFTCAQEFLEA